MAPPREAYALAEPPQPLAELLDPADSRIIADNQEPELIKIRPMPPLPPKAISKRLEVDTKTIDVDRILIAAGCRTCSDSS
jgi:hypothetical protein